MDDDSDLPDLDLENIKEPQIEDYVGEKVEASVRRALKYWPPPFAIVVATTCFAGGYGICWYYTNGGNVIAHWIAIAIFVWGFKHILHNWIAWSSQRATILAREIDKFEKQRMILMKQESKQQKTTKKIEDKSTVEKPSKKKDDFNQDDFDDDAKAMLLKPVSEARKARAKVTGQGLVNTILKSFR